MVYILAVMPTLSENYVVIVSLRTLTAFIYLKPIHIGQIKKANHTFMKTI